MLEKGKQRGSQVREFKSKANGLIPPTVTADRESTQGGWGGGGENEILLARTFHQTEDQSTPEARYEVLHE